jgi:hypothetical protein
MKDNEIRYKVYDFAKKQMQSASMAVRECAEMSGLSIEQKNDVVIAIEKDKEFLSNIRWIELGVNVHPGNEKIAERLCRASYALALSAASRILHVGSEEISRILDEQNQNEA